MGVAERMGMTKVCVLALIVQVGSAAAADDQYNQAIRRHADCTEAAAKKLALQKKGEPYELAREVLKGCKAEEDEIRKHASPELMHQVIGNVVWMRIRTIREARELRQPLMCAACGMTPHADPKSGVWRPYRR